MRGRLAFTGIVVALALTAAACGGGGNGAAAAVSIKTLQAAVSNTQDAESTSFTMDLAVEASGEQMTITADGVASSDGNQAQLTLTLPDLGTIEERVVDGTIYMNFSDLMLGSFLPDGTQWVSVSLDDLQAKTGGAFGDLADQMQPNGPQQGLEYLRGLSGDVEEIGDDTVAGRHATHYRASIDYAKVAEKLPSTESELADELATLGTVPADVWIDDDDRVVKMHFVIDASSFGAGTGKAEMTMEITDFGVPVDVQAPPADETVDLLSLEGLPA